MSELVPGPGGFDVNVLVARWSDGWSVRRWAWGLNGEERYPRDGGDFKLLICNPEVSIHAWAMIMGSHKNVSVLVQPSNKEEIRIALEKMLQASRTCALGPIAVLLEERIFLRAGEMRVSLSPDQKPDPEPHPDVEVCALLGVLHPAWTPDREFLPWARSLDG